MPRFSPETVERVKAAADIVEIVSAHTDLRRSGVRLTGLCPFHDERTPSFSVDPQEKLYHCFGCGVGGDVFRFVEEKEGLSFPEAVEALAERYGVEIETEQDDPAARRRRERRERLRELLRRTAAFYAAYLWSDRRECARAREYLEGRGLGEEVLRDFGVGLAPSAWDQVLTRGQQAGFTPEELRSAGLVQRGRQGGLYDRFRGRIIFPVRDSRGRVLGFGARALRDDQQPKYLNSPEGDLYHKGATLFGIDRAAAAIRRGDEALVVEGYTDALALHQAGFEASVAIMGTAITPEQIATLSGMASRITLALDADSSGVDAMLRAQHVARERKVGMRVVRMPADKDPSDLLAKQPPARFRELVAEALDLAEFRVMTVLDRTDLSTPSNRDRALSEVVPVLAAMGESISRDELSRTVVDRLGVRPELLAQLLSQAERPGSAGSGPPPGAVPASDAQGRLTPQERRERALLAMCIASPEAGRGYIQRLGPEHLSSPVAVKARDWLADNLASPLTGLSRDDQELVSLITHLVMAAERDPAPEAAMELNFLWLEQQLVERRSAEAARRGDQRAIAELETRRDELVELQGRIEVGGS